ncbi:MAG: response regulator [Thermoanaerobaculia bacterium]
MTTPSERRQGGAPASAQSLRLLVVDDDPAYRAYAAAITRRLGFWVDVAVDGESALQHLAVGAYDIVIIDQEMPRLTGAETIARIRASEELKTLYAIMLTAREDIDTRLTALDGGFDDFLTKSSPEREIVAKLVAARRLASRQRTMSVALRDLYGLATRDDLTGVFNRRFFISETERLLIEDTAVNVILMDLDGFKHVNDTYGHLAGDEVLRDVGTALQSTTRSDDVVARFGGDEFVMTVPYVDILTVERIAARVTQAIAALRWSWNPAFRIGVSVGIASSSLLENATVATLVDVADRDMYKNKWVRKHPDLRPELYEYPAHDRNVLDLLESRTRSRKVLVVEDDPSIRTLLATALRREGLEVDVAADGQQALRRCESCEYAVILLDLMMPILNGYQFLDAFERAVPAARSAVFVVTAFDDRMIGSIASPRVHAIIKKPFDIALLATTVSEVAKAAAVPSLDARDAPDQK